MATENLIQVICYECKAVREGGKWIALGTPEYGIERVKKAEQEHRLSHAYCPECFKKYMDKHFGERK